MPDWLSPSLPIFWTLLALFAVAIAGAFRRWWCAPTWRRLDRIAEAIVKKAILATRPAAHAFPPQRSYPYPPPPPTPTSRELLP